MLLSEKLREIRKKRGLSQDAFAIELSVSRQTIINWEKGKSTPESSLLNLIASKYSIDINSLIDDTKNILYLNDVNNTISTNNANIIDSNMVSDNVDEIPDSKVENNEVLYIAKRTLLTARFVLPIYFSILCLSLIILCLVLKLKISGYYIIPSIIIFICGIVIFFETKSRKSSKVLFYKDKYEIMSGIFNKIYQSDNINKFLNCTIEQNFFGSIFKYGNMEIITDVSKINLGGVKNPYKLKSFLEKTY